MGTHKQAWRRRSRVADDKSACRDGLTRRQSQVLTRFLMGDGEKQVARALGISVNTVHTHATRLYRTAGVSSRAELFAKYFSRLTTDGDVAPQRQGS